MDHIATGIEFQMSLLLFVSLAGYLLASRIGQPAVGSIILVGLVVGPSVFNWITYTEITFLKMTRCDGRRPTNSCALSTDCRG